MSRVLVVVVGHVFVSSICEILHSKGDQVTLATTREEALLHLQQERPDFMLVDMSGTHAAESGFLVQMKSALERIKIYVFALDEDASREDLSENVRFNLAEYHIFDRNYTLGSLKSIIEKIRVDMDMERRRFYMNRFLNKAYPYVVNDYVVNILRGDVSDIAEIQYNFNLLSLRLLYGNLQVMSIAVSPPPDSGHQCERIKSIIAKVMEANGNNIVAQVERNLFCALFSFCRERNDQMVDLRSRNFARKIKYELHSELNCVVTIGVSTICRNIKNISTYYNESRRLLFNRIYEGEGHIFHAVPESEAPPGDDVIHDILFVDLDNHLKSGDFDKARACIDTFFETLRRLRFDAIKLHMILVELLSVLSFIAVRSGITLPDGEKQSWLTHDYLLSVSSLSEIKVRFTGFINQLQHALVKGMESGVANKIERIRKYVSQNYMYDISVRDIADMLGLTPNYVSNIFRQSAGITVTRYINTVRIDKAKELLKYTNMKIYEVADKTGFSNPSYFCTVFKEITGTTAMLSR